MAIPDVVKRIGIIDAPNFRVAFTAELLPTTTNNTANIANSAHSFRAPFHPALITLPRRSMR